MATRGVVILMPILTHHLPSQDQAESGNKSVKIPTNFTDKPNTKVLGSMSMAEKQTASKSDGLGTKGFSSSCIIDHRDNNNSQPSFGGSTGGFKTPVPDNHTSDGDGYSLQSHKLMKREPDVPSEHENTTSNPTKQK